MICNNCGNELGINDVFCPKCGKRVLAEEATETPGTTEETPVTEEIPVAEEAPVTEETPVSETENEVESNEEKDPLVNTEGEKPKKKKKKWIKWSIIGVVVAALTAGTVFAFPYIQNIFFRTTMNEEEYFKHVVKNNVTKFADSFLENYAEERELYKNGMGAYSDILIEVGDGTKQLVRQYGEGFDIDWLSNFSLSGTSGFNDGQIYSDIDMKLNGADLFGIESLINNSETYINLPGLTDKAMRLATDDEMSIFTLLSELYQIAPDEKILEELIVRYVMCVVEGIEDVEEENDTVKAGNIEQKYLKMTAKINADIGEKGIKNLLSEAKNDKDIKKIITDVCNTSSVNQNPDEVYAEFQNGIDELLSDIDMSDFDFNFDFVIWVDMKGDIAGMGVEADDVEISYINALKGRSLGTLLSIKTGQFNAAFEGDGTMKSNKFNGEYAVSVNGVKFIDVKVEDVDYNLIKKDIFNGSVVITPSTMAKTMLSSVGNEATSIIADGKIVFKSNTTEKAKSNIELSVYTGSNLLLSLKANASITSVSIPVMDNYIDYTDYEAVEQWGNQILYNLQANLINAGVPMNNLVN